MISGFSHHKLGNVDWRTVSILAVPGFVGAFAGATFLASLDGDTAKPWVAGLLLLLGAYVIWRFLALNGRRPMFKPRPSALFLAPMGVVAGTMDAIGGGGWGPVGTTSLLSSGRLEPRKVIGSIDTSEFVVAVGGSLGFLFALGSQGILWGYAGALLVGGVIAAPIAAWLVSRIPAAVLGVAAGGLIVVTNSKTILEAVGLAQTPVLAHLRRPGRALDLGHRVGGRRHRAGLRRGRGGAAAGPGLTRAAVGRVIASTSETMPACVSPPSPTMPCGPSSRWRPGPTRRR